MASSSSSVRGRFLSSISLSHLQACSCSGVILIKWPKQKINSKDFKSKIVDYNFEHNGLKIHFAPYYRTENMQLILFNLVLV